MSDVEHVEDDGRDIEPAEYKRMLNRALREGDRRLREGKLGDTSLSRYMSQAVTFLEDERRREEAATPNPAACRQTPGSRSPKVPRSTSESFIRLGRRPGAGDGRLGLCDYGH
jgi:hypothetical protein